MKTKICIFICGLISITSSFATIIVRGDDTSAPFGFSSSVVVKAYDRHSGIFYTGIESPSDTFSLAKAFRPSPSTAPHFIGIGTNEILTDETLEFLTIMPAQIDCTGKTHGALLAMVITSTGSYSQTAVTMSTNDGSFVVSTADLNDADGFTTSGITNIAASSCFVAAGVRPSGGSFGESGSGIALLNVDASALTVSTLDAVTGMSGNAAVPFDSSIIELKGDSGGNDVTFSTAPEDVNFVPMVYDQLLNRFYIGVQIATGAEGGDIAKSVVVAQADACDENRLQLFPIVQDSAIPEGTLENKVVVAALETSEDDPINLRVTHIGVMHSSTGPDYLIINGGEGLTEEIGNQVYALPLVNDPCNEAYHGTLAAIDEPLSADCAHTFTAPAQAPDQLLSYTDDRARVGAGNVPMQPYDYISDMVVVGDAVYVSIDITPECDETGDFTTDTGIFYSQALFDAEGKIARWTPWKRATPYNAFPGVNLEGCIQHDGQVKFFDIDAKTGNAWIVEGTLDRFVGYTTWTNGSCNNGLIKQVSERLCNGSYAALDLNQQTRGFAGATPFRYALFGGVDKVVFARVSEGCSIDDPLSMELVNTDFTCCSNILSTSLPDFQEDPCLTGAGCVTSLEYSRRTQEEGNQNYFFAGTETGLYAFNVDGAGFNADELYALDEEPFTSGEWSLIEGIDGAVLDIKTSGKKLYVLTLNHSKEQAFINTLYSIPFANTLKKMFAPKNISIIAQNQVGAFDKVTAFFAIALVATGPVASDLLAPQKEQLILATSNGLFKSNASQNGFDGIIDATNQAQAHWKLIKETEGIAFDGIGFLEIPVAHTVWPFSIANSCSCCTFDRSNIDQLSGTGNERGTRAFIGEFEPLSFNACSCFPQFETLYPITYFWSDGARRFFIINRTACCSDGTELAVLPFDVNEWNVQQFSPLFNPILGRYKQINWVRNIGATGLILAGTNRGVVGLE